MKGEILFLTLLVVAAKAHFVQQRSLTGEYPERYESQNIQEVRTDQFDVEPWIRPGSSPSNNGLTDDEVSSLEQNLLMKFEEITSNLSATNKNLTCEVSPDAVNSLEQDLQLKLEEITSNLSATITNSAFEVLPDAVSSLEQNLLMKLEEMTSSLSATNKNPICEASLEAINSVDQNLLMKLEDMPSKQSLTYSLEAINSVDQRLLMKLEEMSSKQSLADTNSHDAVSSLEQNLLMKLEEMTSNLVATIKKSTFEILRNCGPPFAFIAGGCLFGEPSQKMTWSEARVFCQDRGADLAVFKDVKAFEAILRYMNQFDSSHNHYWIGGTDLLEEDRWLWIDGDDMPRGSPYWSGNEPGGGTGQNCAGLYASSHFLIRDLKCGGHYGPLCQYFPSA